MTKSWEPYALHILDCIEKIHHISEQGDITSDVILYDAALRNLQTLSEATRHLPDHKLQKYSEIPWKDISGFRNILVHNYLGEIDSQTVLNVITVHIIPLEKAIRDMIKSSTDNS